MKNIAFILMVLLSFSCNKDVELNAVEPMIENKTADYNILFEATRPTMVFNDEDLAYETEVTLYLRPFQNVSNDDIVTIQLTSNKPSRFVIPNDTIFSGDKFNLKYQDFKKYLYHLNYQSRSAGQHTINISTSIRDVSKTSSLTISTQEI